MSKSVLISDKSVPFASSLAGSLRGHNVSVALLCGIPEDAVSRKKEPSESSEPSALREIPWNRSSDLSARTLLLETRNNFESLDQAVLIFDAPTFMERVPTPDRMGMMRIVDDYIKGYLLLATEILSLFVKQKKGRLAFVVRSQSSANQATGSQVPSPPGIPLAVAEAAFMRLAEETAVVIAALGLSSVQSLLVKIDGIADAEAATWLVEQLLQPNAPRNQSRWIKAGTKGLLSLL